MLFIKKNAEEKTENTDEFYEIKKLAESIKI